MNILIRNFENCKHEAELVAMLKVYTTPEYYNMMTKDVPITVKDKRLKNSEMKITKQGNGNLCFEFIKELNNE